MTHDADASESTPLLAADAVPSPALERARGWRHRPAVVLAVACAMLTLFEFANFSSLPAQNQIFEEIICRQHYASLNGSAPDCKAEPVQSELGYVLGWKDTFEQVPGIALAVPYGMLADRWGRRPVLLMAMVGVLMVEAAVRVVCAFPETFPLRAVWAVQALYAVGGGGSIASSMLYTIASDIYAPAQRTTVFFVIGASVLVAEVFAAPLGAALVELVDPWVPFWGGLGLMVASAPIALLLPETLPHTPKAPPEFSEHVPALSAPAVRARLAHARATVRHLPRLAAANSTLITLVLVCFVAILARQTTTFLVLYASKRFGWPLARAAYLYSLRSAVNVAQLLLVLPAATHLLTDTLRVSANYKDLVLTRAQLVCCVAGGLAIALAHSPAAFIAGVVVFALGSAFHLTARSLALSLVLPRHYATLNGAVSVVQSMGMIVAGPLLAAAWHQGLVLGGWGLGMPFFLSAGLFALAALVLLPVRVEVYARGLVEEVDEEVGREEWGGDRDEERRRLLSGAE